MDLPQVPNPGNEDGAILKDDGRRSKLSGPSRDQRQAKSAGLCWLFTGSLHLLLRALPGGIISGWLAER